MPRNKTTEVRIPIVEFENLDLFPTHSGAARLLMKKYGVPLSDDPCPMFLPGYQYSMGEDKLNGHFVVAYTEPENSDVRQ